MPPRDSHPLRIGRTIMPKDEWGLKRICPNCSTRFYDLQRDPMSCPACGATFSAESLVTGKSRPTRVEKVKPAVATEIDEMPDIEADEAVIDSDDDLDDDILEDEDEGSVDLDEIADVADDEEET
jgi:uncharacterized protein (TIGR02300 family)